MLMIHVFFFFQAEDGIRDTSVTGVQTCALPICQKFSLYEDLTVAENIRLYGGIYDLSRDTIRERMTRMLERLGLEHAAGTQVRSLPLGWRQKLAFSVALLHEPSIVFLDEPTSGVDPITRRQFWEMIYESATRGTTVFATTHY